MNNIDQIHSPIEKIIKTLGVDGTFTVAYEEGKDGQPAVVDVVLDTPDSSLVIGYHGETLEALQLVLSLVLSKDLNEFVRVSVEVGDYKKNRSEYLENLAKRMKERALTDNREVSLPELKAWERRVVHMILQEDKEVETESIGEGRERTLVIRPR